MTLKAFRLNEFSIYAGVDIEDAIRQAMIDTDCTREEILDAEFGFDVADWTTVARAGQDDTTIGEILSSMSGPGWVARY